MLDLATCVLLLGASTVVGCGALLGIGLAQARGRDPVAWALVGALCYPALLWLVVARRHPVPARPAEVHFGRLKS